MPTYQPTACLTATYSQQFSSLGDVVKTHVPSRRTHQHLYNDEQAYRRIYDEEATSRSKRNKMNDDCNIALGEMTLLYSELDVDEGLPEKLKKIELPIRNESDLRHVSFSMKDLYSDNTYVVEEVKSGLRDFDFNEQLRTHLNIAKAYYPVDELPLKERTRLKTNIETAIALGDFNLVYHHSEQALMRNCLTEDFIDKIISKLEGADAKTFGGVVIDVFSSRLMCNNCAYHMTGFSHYYSAVLIDKINESELYMDFPSDEVVLVHPRVSAEYACSTNDGHTIAAMNDRHRQHKYDVNEHPVTLQSTVTKLHLKSYRGRNFGKDADFFLSSEIRREEVENEIMDRRFRTTRV